jgi:diguanylate cyclase (GGDEF)-like protein/PAS domain S-box-containing protein
VPHRQAIQFPRTSPSLIIGAFTVLMTACVLMASFLKIVNQRDLELDRGRTDIQNLARSLAENAAYMIQGPDIAMSGMSDLLRYQNPQSDRFNRYLADLVGALPQVREFGVLDTEGRWRYSSTNEMPGYSNTDRPYFRFHRDSADSTLRISEPFHSRLTGRLTILLTRRISKADGSFAGVLFAAIDCDHLKEFYKQFNLGKDAGISLIRADGTVLMRTPTFEPGADVSSSDLIKVWAPAKPFGFYKIISPFDGLAKYFGYEKASRYPVLVTVAISESEMLSQWRMMIASDVLVTGVQLAVVLLLSAFLSLQFRKRQKVEATLREREAYFRLLTENIADVVLLLDVEGNLRHVSNSVEIMLGHRASELLGKSCFELVHPRDRDMVRQAAAEAGALEGSNATFRTYRKDGSVVWVETHFRLTTMPGQKGQPGFVGVLRDITERKRMEDELTKLNSRLSQLATTDSLTGLPNRRTFDSFLRREFASADALTVVLIDIDHFKAFNDTYGHQAGDRCLQSVAEVIGEATEGTRALSARYGGEEFVLVLPGVDEKGAIKVAEAIRLRVRALNIPNAAASRHFLTISAGLATRTLSNPDEISLVGEADIALYEAKRRGRNCVVSRFQMELSFHSAPSLQPDQPSQPVSKDETQRS